MALSLGHPNWAHHEGRDVIAHALLLAALRLRRVALRPLGGSAMHDMAAFALAVLLLGLMMLAWLVPNVTTMLVAVLTAIAVLRGRAALGLGVFLRMTVLDRLS